MSKLLMVRHGISEFNAARRFAGYSDVEMSSAGYEQAEKLRDRLAGEKIDAVYSSDLKRASETAAIISSGHEMDIATCSELREVNYGDIEGLTYYEISRLYPEVAETVANFNLRLDFPGGESFKEFITRVSKFLGKLKKHSPSQTLLVVSHSGPLRVLICRLLGIDLSYWWQIRFDNASLSIVKIHPRGAVINLLNDTSHLGE